MIEPGIQYDETIKGALALAHAGGDGVARARRILEAELRANPESFAALDAEAEVLVLAREYDLAARLLEEYIRYFPENADASARFAWVHWSEGNRDEAIAEIRAAVARDPANERARWWLLKWLEEVKDYATMRRTAQEGVFRLPDNKLFSLMLGRAAAAVKGEDAAVAAFTEALRIEPEFSEARESYAEFLMAINKAEGALQILQPALAATDVPVAIRLKTAAALFRLGRRDDAYSHLMVVVESGTETPAATITNLMDTIYDFEPPEQGDRFLFQLLESGRMHDEVASAFVERLDARPNRAATNKAFSFISNHSAHFPKTMMTFLSQKHPGLQGANSLTRWIAENRASINADTSLWGSAGRFFVQRKRWIDAILHLEHYEGRAGLKPWMILMYIRALEAVGRIADANYHCRRALQFEPDDSEAGIRSRLAFNMALEGLEGAGRVIVLDLSRKGKESAQPEDIVRMIAVESLSGAARVPDAVLRRELFDEATRSAKDIASRDATGDSLKVLARYRQKVAEILSRQ